MAVEHALRNSPKPLTVSELLDLPDVRATAIAEYGDEVRVYTDRLSNALGLMWRREVITRYPAPEQANSQARFMCEWPKDKPAPIVLPSTFPQGEDRGGHHRAGRMGKVASKTFTGSPPNFNALRETQRKRT